ncbi:hypothetical protein ACLJKH_001878 [Bacillus cereus]
MVAFFYFTKKGERNDGKVRRVKAETHGQTNSSGVFAYRKRFDGVKQLGKKKAGRNDERAGRKPYEALGVEN